MMILTKKTFKDFKKRKGQFFAIFLIIFLGTFVFSGLNSTWYGMQETIDQFYEQTNASDLWITGNLNAEAEDIEKSLEKVKGVKEVEKRLTVKGQDLAKDGGTLELSLVGEDRISKSFIKEGREFDSTKDSIWIDYYYAQENGYIVGDSITINMFNQDKEYKIVGLIASPEYVYYLASMDKLLPDYKENGYGILAYSENLGSEGGLYNELLIKVEEGYEVQDVKKEIENKIDISDYLIYTREENSSFQLTQDKIDQFKSVSLLFPMLFFIVAMLIMAISMIRLIKEQRYEIGILQALGFKNRKLTRHYMGYAILIALPASILGYLLGEKLFPPYIFRALYMYKTPILVGNQPRENILVILVACLTSVLASYSATRTNLNSNIVANLKESDEIKEKKVFLENTGLWSKIKFENKWVLKHYRQYFVRTFTVIFTVSACMVLMLSALDIRDSVLDIVPWYFEEVNKYESKIILSQTANQEQIKDLKDKYGALSLQEKMIEVETDSHNFLKSLRIIEDGSTDLIKLLDSDKQMIEIKDEGMYISDRLAKLENISPGDIIKYRDFEDNKWQEVEIVGLYKQPINQGFSVSMDCYQAKGKEFKPTSLITSKVVYEEDNEAVAQVVAVKSEKENINTMIKSMLSIVMLMILAAVSLMTIILFNLGSLALLESKSDYLILKSLGFRNGLLKKMFKREMYLSTIIGVIIGLINSKHLTLSILSSMGASTDMMYLGYTKTKVLAFILIIVLSILINSLLARRIDRINLAEELKNRE